MDMEPTANAASRGAAPELGTAVRPIENQAQAAGPTEGTPQARRNLFGAMNATDTQDHSRLTDEDQLVTRDPTLSDSDGAGESPEADIGPPPLMGELARAVGYRGCDAGAGAGGDAVPELAPKPLLVTEAAQRLAGEAADAAGYLAQAEAYAAWWGRRQARLDEQTAVAAEEAAKEAEEKTKAEAAAKLAAELAEQLEGYVSQLEALTVAAAFGTHKNIEKALPWQARANP